MSAAQQGDRALIDEATMQQVTEALQHAMRICDAVPTRLHLSADETQAHIGRLVNAQDDGFHGYAIIRDALEAVNALAQRAASVPAQEEQPNTSRDLDLIKHFADKAFKCLDYAEFFDAEKYPTLPNGRIYDAADNLASIRAIVSRMQEAFAAPVPAASVQPVTVTLDGHQLRMALDFINPDGLDDRDQLDNDLTFGVRQHQDDDGKVSTGMCCWNDDTDGVLPLDGEYPNPEKDNCPACGHPWVDHEFAVPAPYCPAPRKTAQQPDIGRDAALEMKNAIIAVISYGHSHSEAPTAKLARELLGAIERDDRVRAALATQAAPEVASVPDAGDGLVGYVDADAVSTAMGGKDVQVKIYTLPRLKAGIDLPLYTRPQPAPAVLDILDPRKWDEATSKAWHEAIPDMHKAFAELRAAALKGQP